MARVFIDGHMFGETWFKEVLVELVANERVIFSYGKSVKLMEEHSRTRAALSFYKRMGEVKTAGGQRRRDDADEDKVAHHINKIASSDAYKKCAACDDAHIFAIVWIKPTPYVFSQDARMATCRDELNKVLDKEYCRFIVVTSDIVYNQHKTRIHS